MQVDTCPIMRCRVAIVFPYSIENVFVRATHGRGANWTRVSDPGWNRSIDRALQRTRRLPCSQATHNLTRMATRQVALLPALLLATFISRSFEMIHPTASSQWTQWNETPAPPWHETPATGVKHPGGFCGNIAQEWEMLKTHVMSLRVESEALEHMRHRLHEMEEWVKGLDNRGGSCQRFTCN